MGGEGRAGPGTGPRGVRLPGMSCGVGARPAAMAGRTPHGGRPRQTIKGNPGLTRACSSTTPPCTGPPPRPAR